MNYNVEIMLGGRWSLLAENISHEEVNELKNAHPNWIYQITMAQ